MLEIVYFDVQWSGGLCNGLKNVVFESRPRRLKFECCEQFHLSTRLEVLKSRSVEVRSLRKWTAMIRPATNSGDVLSLQLQPCSNTQSFRISALLQTPSL